MAYDPYVARNDCKAEQQSPSAASIARQAAFFPKLRTFGHLRYVWEFYHDKGTDNSQYEGRLTLMKDNINTVMLFWQVRNNYPFHDLGYKHSAHFFKQGVKPVWEDPRNKEGGAWVFRLPNQSVRCNETGGEEIYNPALAFFEGVLMMAVGEQFAEVIQSHDDLCGMSISNRDKSSLISIWNRNGDDELTKIGILGVVLQQTLAHVRMLLEDKQNYHKNYYYKKHSQHKGYDEAVVKAKAAQTTASTDVGVKPDTEVNHIAEVNHTAEVKTNTEVNTSTQLKPDTEVKPNTQVRHDV